MRTWTRRLALAVTGMLPAAAVVFFANAAVAAEATCPLTCHSDRRLKKNIRPI